MRVAVFGGRGFIGQRLARDLPGVDRRLQEESLDRIDITHRHDVDQALRLGKFDVVVNAAGKTGRPNVDWCEDHREETYLANVVGALDLASACRKLGAHLVHLGSGCIFFGRSSHPDGEWREGDFANPLSYYARTKYAADLALAPLPEVAVLRLRMPLDDVPHPRNLVTKLAGYNRVIDVENSITVVSDFVKVVREVAERRLSGIFHAVNPGAIAHREILQIYREIAAPNHRCTFIPEESLAHLGLAVAPRSSAVLASTRLESVGIRMRPIEGAVRGAIAQYAGRLDASNSNGGSPR